MCIVYLYMYIDLSSNSGLESPCQRYGEYTLSRDPAFGDFVTIGTRCPTSLLKYVSLGGYRLTCPVASS